METLKMMKEKLLRSSKFIQMSENDQRLIPGMIANSKNVEDLEKVSEYIDKVKTYK